jgi:hypothetical protein
MKVAILAGSQFFSYDQGMNDFTIEEVSDIEEANEIGAEMSRDVIDSYACISSLIDDIAHDAQENGEDYDEAYENAILEELSWKVFELKDDAPDSIKIDEDYEDFLKKWRK